MGYPKDVLSTRTILKPGTFAVIPPEGLVNNSIPYIEGCRVSVVASPKMGAGFAQYIIEVSPGGKTTEAFGREDNIESFLYCINGNGEAEVDGGKVGLSGGCYIFSPPGVGIGFKNSTDEKMKLIFYKQRYTPLDKVDSPKVIVGNVNDIEYRIYDEMENVHVKDLLPDNLSFDMNMHILSFKPGGCHPFVETHVQEHGAYVLQGEGMYLLDNQWMPIKKDDFIWFGPYVAQGAYGVGTEAFTYIYSKDCNRDVII